VNTSSSAAAEARTGSGASRGVNTSSGAAADARTGSGASRGVNTGSGAADDARTGSGASRGVNTGSGAAQISTASSTVGLVQRAGQSSTDAWIPTNRTWNQAATAGPRIASAGAARTGTDAITGARLWIATAQGIQVVDADGRVVLRLGRADGLPSRSVLSIARLADGRIVAGTSVGAAFVDGGIARRVGPRLGDRGIGNVWAIAETSAGLWLGTTTGLYRGPPTAWTTKDGSDDPAAAAERWQRMSVATNQLRDDWVTALATRGDIVFAGTYHGGIARIDGDTATALGGGWINPSGLVWDGDRLLAATMDGLITGDGRTTTWTATPGLPGRDTTAAVRTGRALWVATRRGLIALD
jgi:ligand-binding sensor domain-containing protein